MKPSILLAGSDIASLAAIVAVLDPRAVASDLVATSRALRHLSRASLAHVHVAVVVLDGSENIAEMRTLLERHGPTRFLFLTPDYPPAPAIARVCAQHGATLFPVDESAIVVGASVVAMLAHDSAEAAS